MEGTEGTKKENTMNNEPTLNFGYELMIRPCEMYEDEYKDCTSYKSRFHQYFVYGKSVDCTSWKRDFNNCKKWNANEDNEAKEELMASEKNRHAQRWYGHVMNDVWENRTEPPDDWNKPLPEWMQQKYKNTYLDLKAKELSGNSALPEHRALCVIL